jgi:hypothetical protein
VANPRLFLPGLHSSGIVKVDLATVVFRDFLNRIVFVVVSKGRAFLGQAAHAHRPFLQAAYLVVSTRRGRKRAVRKHIRQQRRELQPFLGRNVVDRGRQIAERLTAEIHGLGHQTPVAVPGHSLAGVVRVVERDLTGSTIIGTTVLAAAPGA